MAHTHNFNRYIFMWIKDNVQIQRIQIWRGEIKSKSNCESASCTKSITKETYPSKLEYFTKNMHYHELIVHVYG